MNDLMTRECRLERVDKSEDGAVIVDLAMASEIPYERWWGIEVLKIGKDNVRLDRLNDGASLLFNHNWDDLRGVHVKGATRADGDKVLRGKVRIETETQKGKDTAALVEKGILTKSSVGYAIHKVIEKTKTKDGREVEREIDGNTFDRTVKKFAASGDRDRRAFVRELDRSSVPIIDRADDEIPTYYVVDWEPHENSLVTVPADPSVGVGRSKSTEESKTVQVIVNGNVFDKDNFRSALADALKEIEPLAASVASEKSFSTPAKSAAIKEPSMADENAAAGASADSNTRIEAGKQQESPNAVQLDAQRISAIRNIAKANKIDDRTVEYWVANGIQMDGVSEDLLRILEERGKSNPQSAAALGMSQGDAKQFSLSRAINACATNDWKLAPFELDCSRQVAAKLNKPIDTQRFFIPFEVLQRSMPARRDLTTQVPGDGGYLVSTENQGFVEILRNRSVAFRMGARRLSGLNGNVTIPKQTGAATAYWLATESSQSTESTQAFQQIAMTPKTASAYSEISRNLLLQSSPGAEGIVSDDLAQVTAIAVDLAVLSGSGAAGQPTGIVNTSGIGSVTTTTLDYAKVLEFQTDVATANVTPVRGGYVTTPAAAAIAMARQRFSSTDTPLWVGNVWDGNMVGFPAMSSNQLSAGMIFGDWNEVVVGEWGVLEIAVNPYANFQAGIVGVRAMYSVDVAVRRAFAFSYGSSVT